MFQEILLSPQVKRSAIISNKHGICESPNDPRLQENLKTSSNYSLVSSLTRKRKILSMLVQNCRKIEAEPFP